MQLPYMHILCHGAEKQDILQQTKHVVIGKKNKINVWDYQYSEAQRLGKEMRKAGLKSDLKTLACVVK